MLKELRAFQALDVDGDGAICHADLSNVLSSSFSQALFPPSRTQTTKTAVSSLSNGGLLLGASDVASMIAAADLNGDGKVDLAEFQHQLSLYAEERSRGVHLEGEGEQISSSSSALSFSSVVRDIFRVLDADQDGVLCRSDLRAAMAMCGESLSDAQLDAMISAGGAGPAAASSLDFKAFSRLLLHWLT